MAEDLVEHTFQYGMRMNAGKSFHMKLEVPQQVAK